MKYKIEKNTVQETLILPLYSRKLCTELYPNLRIEEYLRITIGTDEEMDVLLNFLKKYVREYEKWNGDFV